MLQMRVFGIATLLMALACLATSVAFALGVAGASGAIFSAGAAVVTFAGAGTFVVMAYVFLTTKRPARLKPPTPRTIDEITAERDLLRGKLPALKAEYEAVLAIWRQKQAAIDDAKKGGSPKPEIDILLADKQAYASTFAAARDAYFRSRDRITDLSRQIREAAKS